MSVFPTAVILVHWLVAAPADPQATSDKGERKASAPTQTARDPFGAVTFAREPMREWKDCLDNSMKGRLLASYGATVFMMWEDQEDGTIPLACLKDEDRKYIQSRFEAIKKAHLFPGAADPADEAAALRLSPAQWQKQLDQWVRAVDDDKSSDVPAAEQAWNHFRSLRDPNAVRPITTLVSRSIDLSVRMAGIESLGHIGGAEAIRTLVKLAVSDRSAPVRSAATWALCTVEDSQGVLAEYVTYLRSDQTREPALLSLQATGLVRPLHSNDVPDRQLTDTLIGILVLKETRKVPYKQWSGYDTGWVPHLFSNGKSRHAHYSARWTWAKFNVPVPCELARKMLVDYTGQDYGYDRQAWRNWQSSNSAATKAQTPNANDQK